MIITVDPSLIRLKNFLIRSSVICLLLLVASCYQNKRPINNTENFPSSTNANIIKNKKSPKAPWEVWRQSNIRNEDFRRGLRLISDGELEFAKESFILASSSPLSKEEEEIVILNLCSTYLKLGDGKKTLECISKYAVKRQKTPVQLDSRFSLLAAYAYCSVNDISQTLAWASQSQKSDSGIGEVSNETRRMTILYLRSIDDQNLDKMLTVWKDDNYISSLIKGEKTRRLQGGSIFSAEGLLSWFDKNTYKLDISNFKADENSKSNLEETYSNKEHNDVDIKNIKFGALLPLSGQYSTHGKHVRDGIELALSQNGILTPLITKDSNVGALAEYEALAANEKVSLVFGPMIAKDSEEVTSVINKYAVPCVSFAKKAGIPDMERGMLRIGGTPENQLKELVKFSQNQLSLQKIALIVPSEEVGQEYRQAFQTISTSFSNLVLESFIYEPRNLQSIDSLSNRLKLAGFDGIIISDTLPQAEPLIRSIREINTEKPPVLLGTSLIGDPTKIKMYSNLMEGMFLVSLYDIGSIDTEHLKFKAIYKAKFSEDPDLLAAQSYDAANFVINTLKQNYTDNNKENVLKSFQNAPNFQGITGELSILESGEIYRTLTILKVDRGKLVSIR